MADVTFEVALRDDASPVLRNVARTADGLGKQLAESGKAGASAIEQVGVKAKSAADNVDKLGSTGPHIQQLTEFLEGLVGAVAGGAQEFARLSGAGVSSLDAIAAAAKRAGAASRDIGGADDGRFEKAKAEALKSSRDAWKEFETTVRGAARGANESIGAIAQNTRQLTRDTGPLRSAIGLVAVELGALGPVGAAAGNMLFQLTGGISALAFVSAAAVIGITAVGAALRRQTEETGQFNAALRAGNAQFFITEIERLEKTVQDLDSTTSTYLGRVGTRFSQFFKGESFFPSKLTEQIDAYKDSLNAIKADKLADITRQFERQTQVSRELTQTGKLELQGQGATEKLIRDLSAIKATSAEIQAAVAALKGSVAANVEAAQQAFVRSVTDQNDALQGQIIGLTGSKQAAIEYAAGLLQAKAAQVGFKGDTTALTKALDEYKAKSLELAQSQFAQQLIQQNQALSVQKVRLIEGDAAADALAQKYAIQNAKLGPLTAATQKLADGQKQLNDELARAAVLNVLGNTERTSGLTKDAAEIDRRIQVLGVGNIEFNAAEALLRAKEKARDALISTTSARGGADQLALDMAIRIQPEIDQLKFDAINERMQIATEIARRSATDFSAELVDILGRGVRDAAAQFGPLDARVQELAAKLNAAKFDKAFNDLNKSLRESDLLADALGVDFDSVGAKIQAVTQGIRELIRQKLELEAKSQLTGIFDPAAAERIAAGIDALKIKLEELREIARVQDAVDGIADGIASALERASNSTESFLTRLKNLANDVLGTINRELTKLLVTDPLKEMLRQSLGDLAGQIGLPVPGKTQGPAGATTGADPAAAAIQATQATASLAIQTESATAQATIEALATAGEISVTATETTATAAIQATQVTASTAMQVESAAALSSIQAVANTGGLAITATQATAETSIKSVETVAIEAIRAAAGSPGGGGGGHPFTSLFSSFGSMFGGSAADSGASSAGGGLVSSMGYHRGGRVGNPADASFIRTVPAALFHNAPRFHGGGIAGLQPGEVPIIARRNERILTEEQSLAMSRTGGERPATVTMNIHGATTPEAFQRSQRAIVMDMERALARNRR